MIRVLVYILIILLGFIISPFLAGNNGYLLFAIGEYEVETSIVFAFIALIIFYSLLQLTEWVIVFFINLLLSSRLLPEKWRKKSARKHTLIGALALAEEDWSTAEKAMLKGASSGELPTVNLLAAARAAHHQGEVKARDKYLTLAEQEPIASTAVNTTRTRYLLQQGELKQAREQLEKLTPNRKSSAPVLLIALELYQAQKDWQALRTIYPIIKKRALLPADQFEQLKVKTDLALLENAAKSNIADLEKCWRSFNRAERKQPNYLTVYSQGLAKHEQRDEAIKLLLKYSKSQSAVEVLATLANLITPEDTDIHNKLFSLEKKHGSDINFQILLAKLYHQQKEYQQAASYWSKICIEQPSSSNHYALATIYEHLGEQNNALIHYKKAAKSG